MYACRLSCFSYVQLFGTLWTIIRQAPLSIYWNGLPCSVPGDLPDPGIKDPETWVSYVSCIGRQVLYQ